MKTVSLIILNWNGKELLAESLPAIQRATEKVKNPVEVIVVDNGSTDGSIEFVRTNYPAFKTVRLQENLGFSEGNNRGAAEAEGQLLVFLNNDMIVDEDFLYPLLSPFDEDPTVFAVASQIVFSDPQKVREETGKTYAFWDRGMVRFLHQPIAQRDLNSALIPVFWAGGGSAAFDREKFFQLQGFRHIYHPAYVEDADLSYRAWKRGWKVLLAPSSRVYHKHRATSRRLFSEDELEILIQRNRLLFHWSNLTSPRLLAEHMLTLPFRAVRGKTSEAAILRKAVRQAFRKWYQARRLARMDRFTQVFSDEELLVRRNWIRAKSSKPRPTSILFVCPYVPALGRHAGAGRMYEVIRGVASKHTVSVLTFFEHDLEQEDITKLRDFCMTVREFAHPEILHCLREELESGQYDLVQYEYLEMAYLHSVVGSSGIPSVFTHHEVQHRSLQQLLKHDSASLFAVIQRGYEWMQMLNFELSLARRFDRVITMTRQDGEALIQYNPDLRISVIETGVNVDFFARFNTVEPQSRSLAFLGYYKHYPNVDAVRWLCTEILPLLRSRSGDVIFYIIGSDPPDEIQQLHDGSKVIVTGRVKDVRPFLAQSCIFVAPIRLGAGIRGKILEAWSMKKPVVSTSLGCSGLRAVHEENLLVADTAEEFADSIDRLLRDQELRQRLGNNGLMTVRMHYDWSFQIQKHLALYDEILGRPQQ
jgi:GT2 family glycosyltransferase